MSDKPLTVYSTITNSELKYFEESGSILDKDSGNENFNLNCGYNALINQSYDWDSIAHSKFSNLTNQEIDEVKVDFKITEELDLLYDEDSVSSLKITPMWLAKELRPTESSNSITERAKFRLQDDKNGSRLNEYSHQSIGDSYFARAISCDLSETSFSKRQKVSEVDMQRWILDNTWNSAINLSSADNFINEKQYDYDTQLLKK